LPLLKFQPSYLDSEKKLNINVRKVKLCFNILLRTIIARIIVGAKSKA